MKCHILIRGNSTGNYHNFHVCSTLFEAGNQHHATTRTHNRFVWYNLFAHISLYSGQYRMFIAHSSYFFLFVSCTSIAQSIPHLTEVCPSLHLVSHELVPEAPFREFDLQTVAVGCIGCRPRCSGRKAEERRFHCCMPTRLCCYFACRVICRVGWRGEEQKYRS